MSLPSNDDWAPLLNALDRLAMERRCVRLWLRDDDAVAATPALDQLLAVCRPAGIVPLIAIIPARLEPSLPLHLSDRSATEIAVHGSSHTDHAPPGRKSEEMAPERGEETLIGELTAARRHLVEAFGREAGLWYVPPWNRIQPGVTRLLPPVGFSRLSTFGPRRADFDVRLDQHNTHVDLIDWRGGRRGRSPAWIAAEVARQVGIARERGDDTIGILAHHLAHDEIAWSALEGLIRATASHAAVRWVPPSALQPVP